MSIYWSTTVVQAEVSQQLLLRQQMRFGANINGAMCGCDISSSTINGSNVYYVQHVMIFH